MTNKKKNVIRKFGWINLKFFHPDPRPPDFKPDWRHCAELNQSYDKKNSDWHIDRSVLLLHQ